MTINTLFEAATYSPEDNKLRLYLTNPEERVSDEIYQELKDAGFRWAHVQKLYVSPSWSVEREDVCLKYADVISCEDTTIAERAIQRAERFDGYAQKRSVEASGYALAASTFAERINNQPALNGHHSQRKIEKAEKDAKRAEIKAEIQLGKANYWLRRAVGVESFANMKNRSSVRAGRIEKLKKDLRDVQKSFNHAFLVKKLWTSISEMKDDEKRKANVKHFYGLHLVTGPTVNYSTIGRAYYHNEITFDELITKAIADADRVLDSQKNTRMITHTLNRLAYERYELGAVSRHEGKVTATMIKGFARENGAHKPECERVDGQWELSSSVPLPLHVNPLGEHWLVLDDEEWIDLFEQIGYVVPAPKPKAPSILNFKADEVEISMHGTTKWLKQIAMTKAEYAAIYKDDKGCKPTPDGLMRVKIAKDPSFEGEYWNKPWVSVYLTDSKNHAFPITNHIKVTVSEEVA